MLMVNSCGKTLVHLSLFEIMEYIDPGMLWMVAIGKSIRNLFLTELLWGTCTSKILLSIDGCFGRRYSQTLHLISK